MAKRREQRRATGARRATQSSQPIAKKLRATFDRYIRADVVDLEAVRGARVEPPRVARPDELRDFHPAHALYIYAQNMVSVWVEQLSDLDETRRLSDLVFAAQADYMPKGPPMSPLTTSYFTLWAFFDACVGRGKETFGTALLALADKIGMDPILRGLLERMQASRMGVYAHEGVRDGEAVLREMVTGEVVQALCPAGYPGVEGEEWYVRILPPPLPELETHVAMTTPYVLIGDDDWEAYFERTLPQGAPPARAAAYADHMKYGPTRRYWNDFVLEAYVGHRHEAIFMRGLPDVPESRPHSRANTQ